MGQTYAVSLRAEFLNKELAAAALRAKLDRAEKEHVKYCLDHYREIGIGTETIEDLMRIFFGGWEGRLEPHSGASGWLGAGFDASYGWENVMMDAFDLIAPFLEDGSEIEIYPDSGRDIAYVEGGEAVWQ